MAERCDSTLSPENDEPIFVNSFGLLNLTDRLQVVFVGALKVEHKFTFVLFLQFIDLRAELVEFGQVFQIEPQSDRGSNLLFVKRLKLIAEIALV